LSRKRVVKSTVWVDGLKSQKENIMQGAFEKGVTEKKEREGFYMCLISSLARPLQR